MRNAGPPSEIGRLAAVLPQREETAFPLGVHEYVSLGRFPHLGLWKARSSADGIAVERAIEAVADAIHHHADRTAQRAKLTAAGRKRVTDFDSEKVAQRTREVLGL